MNEQELLDQARKEIAVVTDEQDKKTYLIVLEESMKELVVAEAQLKEFTDIRNKAIKNLYVSGLSAIELGSLTGLSRQMIHKIVK